MPFDGAGVEGRNGYIASKQTDGSTEWTRHTYTRYNHCLVFMAFITAEKVIAMEATKVHPFGVAMCAGHPARAASCRFKET